MNAVSTQQLARLILVVLACPMPALATTVYRSIDEHGAVHFSDTPPAGVTLIDTLHINTPKPVEADVTEQRMQAMRETTDRMAADRMARERHRAELRKLGSETDLNRAALAAPAYPVEERYYDGPYGYPVYPRRRWHRAGHGRPTPLPQQPVITPARPVINYPASRIRRHYSPQVRDFFNR